MLSCLLLLSLPSLDTVFGYSGFDHILVFDLVFLPCLVLPVSACLPDICLSLFIYFCLILWTCCCSFIQLPYLHLLPSQPPLHDRMLRDNMEAAGKQRRHYAKMTRSSFTWCCWNWRMWRGGSAAYLTS
ncbi:hypothetical protein AMELA_G00288320, partial [Ameiurus melas]